MTKKNVASKLRRTWNAYLREMKADLEKILRDADMWYSPDGESIPRNRNALRIAGLGQFPSPEEIESRLMTRSEIKTAFKAAMMPEEED